MDDRAHVGQPEHLDDVAVLEWLRRLDMIAHDPVEPDTDDVAVAGPAAVIAVDAGDRAFRDLHEAQIRVVGGWCEGDVERHPVERGAHRVGHHRRGLGEHLAFAAHALRKARGVGRPRESHRLLRFSGLVGGAVHRFRDPDFVDALA